VAAQVAEVQERAGTAAHQPRPLAGVMGTAAPSTVPRSIATPLQEKTRVLATVEPALRERLNGPALVLPQTVVRSARMVPV
jgi:hypothetical protein